MQTDKFKELLEATAIYYDKGLPLPVIFEIWFNSMKKFSLEAVSKAFAKHINTPDTGRFMPKVADITKILEGTSKDGAYVAWTKVKDSIAQVGMYESICFDDAIIHLVIKDLGGWITLCQKQDKELPFIANEFRSRYEGYKSKADIPNFPKRLAGIHESDNTRKCLTDHIPKPVLVGDRMKALMISTARGTIPADDLKKLIQPKGE